MIGEMMYLKETTSFVESVAKEEDLLMHIILNLFQKIQQKGWTQRMEKLFVKNAT